MGLHSLLQEHLYLTSLSALMEVDYGIWTDDRELDDSDNDSRFVEKYSGVKFEGCTMVTVKSTIFWQ
jgi:hypothetical protein